MSSDFETLIDKIKATTSYEQVKGILQKIIENKDSSQESKTLRALRDAEVYALCWGVHIALEGDDDSMAEVATQAMTQDAQASINRSSDDLYADYQAAVLADDHYREKQEPISSKIMIVDPISCDYPRREYLSTARSYYNKKVSEQEEKAKFNATAELISSLKGKYLMITRKTTSGGGNVLIEQGILESVNVSGGTFVLKSTVYEGRRDTVSFSDVKYVDTSRSGPGALGAVSAPDWRINFKGDWVRSDTL